LSNPNILGGFFLRLNLTKKTFKFFEEKTLLYSPQLTMCMVGTPWALAKKRKDYFSSKKKKKRKEKKTFFSKILSLPKF